MRRVRQKLRSAISFCGTIKTQDSIPGYSSGCVLLVDDDNTIRIVVADVLNDLGYRVLTAKDGADAIKVFRKKQNEIDLVLLDMMMPVMNGADCFYRLKTIKPDVQVLMASGFVDGEDIDKLERDGMLGHIAKPYYREKLQRLLAEYIHH